MVKCETVTLTFDHAEQGLVRLVIPAYTRTQASLMNKVHYLLDQYLAGSESDEQPVSLSDFCMWLIHNASMEPLEQERIAE